MHGLAEVWTGLRAQQGMVQSPRASNYKAVTIPA